MISNYFIGARINVLLYSTRPEEAGWVGSKTKPKLPTERKSGVLGNVVGVSGNEQGGGDK